MILNELTAPEIEARRPKFAVLPIGSFEQHGAHLPATTDTLIACAVAVGLCAETSGLLLPPIGMSCSQEHAGFSGTLSLSSTTLSKIVGETLSAVEGQGIGLLVVINAHGGNYVLSNVAQELNASSPRVLLGIARHHWEFALRAAGAQSSLSEDMHGGEIETSILLHVCPDVVKMDLARDWSAPLRPMLTLLGMRHYSPSGVIGRPTLAEASKGKKILDGLVGSIRSDVEQVVTLRDTAEGRCSHAVPKLG